MEIEFSYDEKFMLQILLQEENERNKEIPFMKDRVAICDTILKKIKDKWEGKTMKKYIVRGDRSGVFYGEIKEREGKEVTMINCRRLWYWDGANSLSQLAQLGTTQPLNCKFTVPVDEVTILDAIEIDECSEAAIKIIDEVPQWIK